MEKLRILLLEDNKIDAELIREELDSSLSNEFELIRVESKNDFLKQIYLFKPDIILSDYRLPQYNGLRALEDLLATGLDIPFIIVTGSLSEETAADSIKAGAWDYVVKERLFRLPTAVKNVLLVRDEREKKKKIEVQLQILSSAVEHASVSVTITNKGGDIQYVNPKFEELTGYSKNEVIGKNPRILKSGEHEPGFYKELWDTILKGEDWNGIFLNKKKNNDLYYGKSSISCIRDDDNEIIYFIGIEEDITEQINSENALKASEERFQLLSAATFEAIFISENGICTNQNATAERMFGYTLKEAEGKPLTDWIAPESRDLVTINLNSDFSVPYEAIAIRKDGTKFSCEIQGRMLDYKGGTIRLTALRDITQRKIAEKALIRSERKYRELIENQGEGIVLANKDDIISLANPAAEDIFGVEPDGLIGRSVEEFTSEEEFKKIRKESKKRLKGDKSTYEIVISRKDKKSRYVLITATPRRDDKGRVTGSFGIFRDITERKQMLDELKEAKDKAEEGDRLKTVFLQNMSHEIRTPMNGIMGFAEMLNEPDLDESKRRSYADIIINNGKQLLTIIQDIITISSLETKQEKIHSEPTSVNDILFELQTIYSPDVQSSGLNLFTKKDLPDEKAYINTDPAKLRQILDNLLSNAFKFTAQGYIEMGYKLIGSELQFFVRDSGIGIKKSLQDKIFNRFWQVEQGTTRRYGGTGLGLAISKGYVGLLGGKIWLESEPGKGSSFYFSLPYSPVKKSVKSFKQSIDPNNIDWKGKTILIAEDEAINYLFLEELIKKTGAKVLLAKNGNEAIEIANNTTVDLILMDIKMPEKGGYAATAAIREKQPDLPIIAQTAYINTEDRAKALAAGCNDFLPKPLTLENIVSTIENQWKIIENSKK